MEISTSRKGRADVITIKGDLDAAAAPAVLSAADELLLARASALVINMAGVPFLDSSGLATLVRLLKRSSSEGFDLRLCHLQQRVSDVFELTRMNQAFQIFATLDEATAPFR